MCGCDDRIEHERYCKGCKKAALGLLHSSGKVRKYVPPCSERGGRKCRSSAALGGAADMYPNANFYND